MAINVTKLEPQHFVSTETRDRIHALTDTPEGPTMAERLSFSREHNVRNVTKYWPVSVVLAACDRWAIEPVLGKGGAKFVARAGGLTYSKGAGKAPEGQGGMFGKFDKPKVTVGEKKQDAPTGAPEPVPEAESERARKLAALEALVARKVEEARGRDDEAIKDLIASVSGAAASAVLETKGKALLMQLKAQTDETINAALELIEQARPVVIDVRTSEDSTHRVTDKVHAAFPWVMRLAALRLNIALIGPTGCGKTHLAAQVCAGLGMDSDTQYATVSCTMGMSESKLVGGLLPLGEGGQFTPYVSDFVRLYRDGGVFLLDEWDSADPNVALIVNQALANGHIDLPVLGRIKRHPDFVCIAALNTFGTGANRQYVGRSQLDEATLDRFRAGQVELDYDRKLEQELVPSTRQAWLKRAWEVRDAINRTGLRRNVSTRFILDGCKLLSAGATQEQVLTTLVMGWSKDEQQKVGVTPVKLF